MPAQQIGIEGAGFARVHPSRGLLGKNIAKEKPVAGLGAATGSGATHHVEEETQSASTI
jgi:hypothetical protein